MEQEIDTEFSSGCIAVFSRIRTARNRHPWGQPIPELRWQPLNRKVDTGELSITVCAIVNLSWCVYRTYVIDGIQDAMIPWRLMTLKLPNWADPSSTDRGFERLRCSEQDVCITRQSRRSLLEKSKQLGREESWICVPNNLGYQQDVNYAAVSPSL